MSNGKEQQRIKQLEFEISRKMKTLEAMVEVLSMALKRKKTLTDQIEFMQSELEALKQGQFQFDSDLDF